MPYHQTTKGICPRCFLEDQTFQMRQNFMDYWECPQCGLVATTMENGSVSQAEGVDGGFGIIPRMGTGDLRERALGSLGKEWLILRIEEGAGGKHPVPCRTEQEFRAFLKQFHEPDSCTSLHTAAREGNTDAVRALLDHGANLEERDEMGFTPLHRAAAKGNVNIVRLLLDRGAEINARDKEQQTPLFVAAMTGKTEMVRFLVEKGADVDVRDKESESPLLWAVVCGEADTVSILIDNDADVNLGAEFEPLFQPLHAAVNSGNIRLARTLLEHGANVGARDPDDFTPLHLAVLHAGADMARLLLEHGADSNAPHGNEESTPLHYAVSKGYTEKAHLLLEMGADANMPNKGGSTPLDTARNKGNQEIINLLEEGGGC